MNVNKDAIIGDINEIECELHKILGGIGGLRYVNSDSFDFSQYAEHIMEAISSILLGISELKMNIMEMEDK